MYYTAIVDGEGYLVGICGSPIKSTHRDVSGKREEVLSALAKIPTGHKLRFDTMEYVKVPAPDTEEDPELTAEEALDELLEVLE